MRGPNPSRENRPSLQDHLGRRRTFSQWLLFLVVGCLTTGRVASFVWTPYYSLPAASPDSVCQSKAILRSHGGRYLFQNVRSTYPLLRSFFPKSTAPNFGVRHAQNPRPAEQPERPYSKDDDLNNGLTKAPGAPVSYIKKDGLIAASKSWPLQVAGVSVSSSGFWTFLRRKESFVETTAMNPFDKGAGEIDNLPLLRRMRASLPQMTGDTSQTTASSSSLPPSVEASGPGETVVRQELYLPICLTHDPLDRQAATSAEALTILQLLAGVDMAGAILPPDLLSQIVVRTCELVVPAAENRLLDPNDQAAVIGGEDAPEIVAAMNDHVQRQLPNATGSYTEQHPWIRARVRLPTCRLEKLWIQSAPSQIDDTALSASTGASYAYFCQVSIQGIITRNENNPNTPYRLTLRLTNSVLKEALYQFSPQVSSAFVALTLALRYRASIYYEDESLGPSALNGDGAPKVIFLSLEELQRQFPLYKSRGDLRQTSQRVTANIDRSLKINQLQAAMNLARQKGDAQAEAKIRTALDDLDRLDDLPVQPESDIDEME